MSLLELSQFLNPGQDEFQEVCEGLAEVEALGWLLSVVEGGKNSACRFYSSGNALELRLQVISMKSELKLRYLREV